jgi:hypothetical protein
VCNLSFFLPPTSQGASAFLGYEPLNLFLLISADCSTNYRTIYTSPNFEDLHLIVLDHPVFPSHLRSLHLISLRVYLLMQAKLNPHPHLQSLQHNSLKVCLLIQPNSIYSLAPTTFLPQIVSLYCTFVFIFYSKY